MAATKKKVTGKTGAKRASTKKKPPMRSTKAAPPKKRAVRMPPKFPTIEVGDSNVFVRIVKETLLACGYTVRGELAESIANPETRYLADQRLFVGANDLLRGEDMNPMPHRLTAGFYAVLFALAAEKEIPDDELRASDEEGVPPDQSGDTPPGNAAADDGADTDDELSAAIGGPPSRLPR